MIEVAKIGRTVGVSGGVKLHLLTDFPQIFSEEIVFSARRGGLKKECFELQIKNYKDGIAYFVGYESLESAKSLTNVVLSMSIDETKRICQLGEGEAFWFDVIGCEIIENGECLGRVKEIERIGSVDYLIVQANCGGEDIKQAHYDKQDAKTSHKLPACFMIPYIERYILSCDGGKIYTQDAKEIWLAS